MKFYLPKLSLLFWLLLACNANQPLSKKSAMPVNEKTGIQLIDKPAEKRVDILLNGQFFTSYIYPDNIAKPVLYPLLTQSEKNLTRGYPLEKRPNERVDHAHHVGYWLNYGDVNGLDFWNNSEERPEEKKHLYGSILHQEIRGMSSGTNQGALKVKTHWNTPDGNTLLEEQTKFIFFEQDDTRFIDRITTLTAIEDVSFDDNKEGMVAVRVARPLELPSQKPAFLTDAQGDKMTEKTVNNDKVVGDYLSSEGGRGKGVWGTRARWMQMHSKMEGDPVALVLIDHPSNIGYPTYWHARDYGLFSANPLGQKVFSKGKEVLSFKLAKGESATFRYRLLVQSGSSLTSQMIDKIADDFANLPGHKAGAKK